MTQRIRGRHTEVIIPSNPPSNVLARVWFREAWTPWVHAHIVGAAVIAMRISSLDGVILEVCGTTISASEP